jgi:hypothetical protein
VVPLVPVVAPADFELSDDIAFERMNFSVAELAAPDVPVGIEAARCTQPVTVTLSLELLVCEGLVVCAATPIAAAHATAANVPVHTFLHIVTS